jgi:hypothetical protein
MDPQDEPQDYAGNERPFRWRRRRWSGRARLNLTGTQMRDYLRSVGRFPPALDALVDFIRSQAPTKHGLTNPSTEQKHVSGRPGVGTVITAGHVS